MKHRIRDTAALTDSHNKLYDEHYFRTIDIATKQSAEIIASHIAEHFHPSTLLDVGCGTGALLDSLRSKDIVCQGLEYSEAALKYCRDRGLSVRKFDLEKQTLEESERFDVVVSMEVAEHLPESCANRFVDLLCQASSRVVFTAATPDQSGHDHVNLQPHIYWIEKFRNRDFVFEEALSLKWREDWKAAKTASWFYRNLMLFHKLP